MGFRVTPTGLADGLGLGMSYGSTPMRPENLGPPRPADGAELRRLKNTLTAHACQTCGGPTHQSGCIIQRVWVLVVEDEPSMGELLRQGLEEENHTVTLTRDGLEGVHAAETCNVDAIVLDVMVPGLNGIAVTQRLRASGRQTPILMLTARDAPADIVAGLDAGADDYLTKPFSLKVLLARLRALSRRAVRPAVRILRVRDLTLDPSTHLVTRAGRVLDLTSTEFRVLEFLMRRTGRACSRASIIDGVWGMEQDVKANTVDAFIRLLRGKVDAAGERPALIQTVRGYGYIVRDE
jgi:DNA-binding response OmpR family regulator